MPFGPANRKALGLIFLVLALGIGLGAVGEVFINQRVLARPQVAVQNQGGRAPAPLRAVPRLTKELDLTAGQQQQLGAILTQMQQGFDGVRQQMNPQFDQIREQGRDQIRQILTPEQRPKFEDFLQRSAEDRRRRNNPGRQ
jgi:Spy/CpxP family protein refolding chaperone